MKILSAIGMAVIDEEREHVLKLAKKVNYLTPFIDIQLSHIRSIIVLLQGVGYSMALARR